MLPDRFDKSIEQKWQKNWEEQGTYCFDESDSSRKIYSIDTPPPFTSGDLHMGHVLSYSYFDFVARYKRMKGFNVYYPQGWDCQGFPTEVKVEQKFGRLPREEFRQKCVEWTGECIAKMKSQMMTMGFSADWKYEYRTMDPAYHKRVQYSLLKMHEKGLVYRAEHPVFFCTKCVSALAKTDTDEVERDTTLNYLKFTANDGTDLIIATTRPEYLHACVAVLFHPDDRRYGKYANEEITTPLGKKVKLLADKDVDLNFGSGLVMLCTFGDKQDVVWMYRHNLPVIRAMDEFGKLVNAGEFNGLKVQEARKKILEKLEAEGKIVKKEPLKQVVKVHDRCKTPVELLLSTQWFAKVKDRADDIIGAARKMKWVPDFGIQYLIDWAKFVEWDWVISRQRVFGTPLPFWYCKKCNKDFPAKESELPVNPPTMAEKKCPDCGEKLVGEVSTCDCWVDSSITPLSIAQWPENKELFAKVYPASLRPQGVEIVRTWAYYTIYRCLELTGKPCFGEILLNGNVLAPDGKKMSKSLGNIIAPDKLIDDYSADAVRQWAALSGAMAKDRPFNFQDIQYAKSFNNKLLNAAKFTDKLLTEANETGTAARNRKNVKLRAVDKWILSRLNTVAKSGGESFEAFEFHKIMNAIQSFFWHEVCDYYLEYSKWRVYNGTDEDKAAVRYTLCEIFSVVLRLLAPIAPHISEEIYQSLFPEEKKSIHLLEWPTADEKLIDCDLDARVCKVNALVAEIWKARTAKQMKPKDELASVSISADFELSDFADEVKSIAKAKQFEIKKGEYSLTVA